MVGLFLFRRFVEERGLLDDFYLWKHEREVVEPDALLIGKLREKRRDDGMRVLMEDRDGVKQVRHVREDSFDESRMKLLDDVEGGNKNG